VPLSIAAAELLTLVPRQEERDLVFGSGKAGFSGWSKAKVALDGRVVTALQMRDAKAKLQPWRLHDIRRTVATGLAELGTLPHVVEAILNHVSGHKAGVAGVYNRAIYAAEKRVALEMWARHLAQLR
jgi:integrase